VKSFESNNRTFPIKWPVAVLMEQEDRVELAIVELGPAHACVRTTGRWRSGDAVVITVSVPETSEKTQALFRLHSSVRRRTRAEEREGAYVLDFENAGINLTRATELLGRFRTRGLVDQ
jgi:hypothetical protein